MWTFWGFTLSNRSNKGLIKNCRYKIFFCSGDTNGSSSYIIWQKTVPLNIMASIYEEGELKCKKCFGGLIVEGFFSQWILFAALVWLVPYICDTAYPINWDNVHNVSRSRPTSSYLFAIIIPAIPPTGTIF